MAEENQNQSQDDVTDSGADQNIQTLHALHLDGKGAPTLDEADERSLNEQGDIRPEDVTGNANVQSAGRTTFEQMVQGGIQEAPVVPTGDNVVPDTVTPSEGDNQVAAQFDNVHPAFTPTTGLDEPDAPATPDQPPSPDFAPQVTPDPENPIPAGPDDNSATSGAPAPAAFAETLSEPPLAEDPTPDEIPEPEEIIPRVADAPAVTVQAASGTEDTDTRLDITVATADRDGGSETISAITISGVPAGFSFVNAAGQTVGVNTGNGSWSFTQDLLQDLYLRQPGNYSGDITLTVSATSTEISGDTATTTLPLSVHVEAVADAPGLDTRDAAGMEDQPIALSITVTNNDTGTEGAGAYAAETQTVYIDRLPSGATLIDGATGQAITTRLDDDLVVDGATIPAGSYVVSAAQLASLQVQSAPNDSADFSLDVWATSTEPSNGSVAITGFQTIDVDVGIVAPVVAGEATGQEGSWTTLDLSATVEHDLAGDQETLTVYVEGLPDGAEIRFADGTVPTIVVVDGVTRYDVTGHLDEVQVRWTDSRSDTDMDLTLRGVVHDTDVGTDRETPLGDTTAPDWNQSTATVHVTVQAVADGPSELSASGIGVEDKWFDLDITTGLIDTDDGSEVLTVQVAGPAGFLLADKNDTDHPYAGVTSDDGTTVTYTLTQAQLDGLQMRAKPDSDTDIALTIKATATETATGDDQIALAEKSLTIPLTVTVLSDADTPIVSVVKDTQTIDEDALFDLSKSVTGTFSDGTTPTTHAAVSGGSAESGSTLGGDASGDGSETITYRITANQDSRISLDGGATVVDFPAGSSVTVNAEDIRTGLVRLGGVEDWASSAGTPHLTFSVVTIATEATNDDALETADLARETVRESAPAILTIAVNPVADVATATLSVVASGYEDGLSGAADHTAGASGDGIAITPTLTLSDADHSETPTGVLTITSTDPNMIAGEIEVTGGTVSRVDTVENGVVVKTVWTVEGADYTTADNATFTFGGLVFKPEADNDSDPKFDLAVQFQDSDGGPTAMVQLADQTVTVAAVADAPTLSTTAAGGLESASGPAEIALAIDANLTDGDGSETLYVYVTGIPADAATLSSYAQVVSGDVTIGGVTISGSADTPVYKLAVSDLENLKLVVNQGCSEDMRLTVYAQSVEGENGDVAVTGPSVLDVDIGVLAPTIGSTGPLAGAEDDYVSLASIVTQRQAGDATDSLSVYVEGLPDGASLYKLGAGGTYVALEPAEYQDASGATHTGYDVSALVGADGSLAGVYVKWDDANKADAIDFTLRSVVADVDADAAADAGGIDRATAYDQPYRDITDLTQDFTVTLTANADQPNLSASAIGVEDQWVAIDIDAALIDTDGSENLSVTISGVPAGMTLSAGTVIATAGDGTTTWQLDPATDDLHALKLTGLAPNSDADFDLVVRATATENGDGAPVGTATATREVTVNVQVLSDADKPVVSVIQDTQTIDEDAWFNLATQISGGYSDAANADHAAVTATAGETGSVQGEATSADSSETLTYRITANQDSRITTDGGLTVKDFAAGQTIEVTAAQIASGKVLISGVEDWASSADNPNLTFSIVAVATETRGAADDALDDSLPDGLSRSSVSISAPAVLTLAVTPVVDSATATLTVSAVGYEDGLSGYDHTAGATGSGIAVNVTLELTDADKSEKPTGAVTITSTDPTMIAGTLELSGGTIHREDTVVDGVIVKSVWTIENGTFTTADNSSYALSGLVFKPQADNANDPTFDLSVKIQDTTTGVVADKDALNQTIVVNAVADQPLVEAHDTAFVESATGTDTFALDIDVARGADADGSETLYVLVTNLPKSAGTIVGTNVERITDGSIPGLGASDDNPVYRVLASDVDSLRLQPAAGWSTDLTLTVYSQTVEQEGDSALSAPDSLRVDIGVLDPVVDAPTSLTGNEDARISLSSVKVTLDAVDGSETRTVYVEAPSDVTLFDSSNKALTRITFTDADGVTHSGYDVSSLIDASTGALRASARNSAANDDGNFSLKVFALAQDVDSSTNTATNTAYGEDYQDTAQVTATIAVTVRAMADQPGQFSVVAAGVEDKWVALNLASLKLADTDGSETLSVTISGVPEGLTLTTADSSVQITQVNATTWKIEPVGDVDPTKTWLADTDLRITGLADAKEDLNFSFPLTVTATSTEHGTDGEIASGKTTSTPRTVDVTVTVLGDADIPVVEVTAGATVATAETVAEDEFYNLNDAIRASSGENPGVYGYESTDGSETLSFRVTVSEDCVIKIGDTVYELKAGDTLPVSVSAQDIAEGKVWVGGTANWGSVDGDSVLGFQLTPIATEGDANASTDALNASNAVADEDLTRQTTAEGTAQWFYLKVTPQADTTDIVVSAAGLEDSTGIAIAPTITLRDTDGSESLTGTVDILVRCDENGDFPGTIAFSGTGLVDAGTEVYEGVTYHVYQVPVDQLTKVGDNSYQLNGATFAPTPNSDIDIQYCIRTTTVEKGNSNSYTTVSTPAVLAVAAVADAPALSIDAAGATTDANGVVTVHDVEDGGTDGLVSLDLKAALTDTDGSETLTNVELRSVPKGWGVVVVDQDGNTTAIAGTDGDGDGLFTFVINPSVFAEDSGLSVALVPPANSDVDVSGLQVWAKSTETAQAGRLDGDTQIDTATAEKTLTFNVQLDPVADKPTLMVTSARTSEDAGVALDIRASVTDSDETASVTITGVPTGGVLTYVSAETGLTVTTTFGGDVTSLTCSAAEARSLRFIPPPDASGKFTLSVTATATDTDPEGLAAASTASDTKELVVYARGVNDAILDAGGHDITTIGNLTAQGTEDANGNLVSLNLGSYSVDDIDGSETLSAVISGIPSGFTLVVKTEDGVQDLAGTLQYIGKDANGGAIWSVPTQYLDDIYIRVPHNYAGDFDLDVRLVTTEADGAATAIDKTLTVSVEAVADGPNISVAPSVTEDGFDPATGIPVAISVTPSDTSAESPEHITAITIDVDVPAGLPENTVLHLKLGDIVVEIGAGAEFTITPDSPLWASYDAATGKIEGLSLLGVPDGWSKNIALSVSATSEDINGTTASSSTSSAKVVITAQADEPDWSLNSGAAQVDDHWTGTASIGQAVDMGLSATAGDPDGSESIYFIVSGVPNGVVLNHGYNNGDGTWTVLNTGEDGWTLTATSTYSGQATLTVTPVVVDKDPDGGSDRESFAAKTFVLAVTDENGGIGTWPDSEATAPALSSSPLDGVEENAVSLGGVTASAAAGDTVSAIVLTLPAGVTVVSTTDDDGNTIAWYNPVSGSWTIDPVHLDDFTVKPPKDLSGTFSLELTAVSEHNGLTSSTTSTVAVADLAPVTDGASLTAAVTGGDSTEDGGPVTFSLTVEGNETQYYSEILEDGTITVSISTSGSSTPPGTLATGTLANGAVVAEGSTPGTYVITLTEAQKTAFANGESFTLEDLSFTPAANFSGTVSVGFSTSVVDPGADAVTSTGGVSFTVTPEVDSTTFVAGTMSGNEDSAIALNLTIEHQDLAGTGDWGSETASVVITGVPAGAIIQGATNNGPVTVDGVTTYSWTVKRANLEVSEDGITLKNVSFVSASDDSSDVALTFTTYVFEKGSSDPVSSSATYTVTVDGVTDGAILNPVDAVGVEDKVTAIDLGAELIDIVGTSEETYIQLSGLPSDCTFTDADGVKLTLASEPVLDPDTNTTTWTFSTTEVAALGLMTGGKLYVVGPANVSGSWNLTAQAFTRDTDGANAQWVASNALPLTLTLTAEADTPTLTLGGDADATEIAAGMVEDGTLRLDLGAALKDTDGSESLGLTITGAPAGSVILVDSGDGTVIEIHGQDGVWTISASTALSLDTLSIVPPANYNGDFTLEVTASATEMAGGSASSATKQIHVTVDAGNDAPVTTVVSGGIGIEGGVHTTPVMLLKDADQIGFTDVDFGVAETVMLGSMTVSISGGSGRSAADSLSLDGLDVTLAEDGTLQVHLDDGSTVTVAYDHASQSLTFTGAASAEQYADLARHVVFSSQTEEVAAGTRVVSFSVTDLEGAASTGTTTGITVTVAEGASLQGAASGDVSFTDAGAPVLAAGTLGVVEDADPFSLGLSMAWTADADIPVTISGLPAGTVLLDANNAVVDPDSLTAGQLAGLRVDLPDDWNGSVSLTVTATAGATTLTEQVTVTATAVNDAPNTSAVTLTGTDEGTAFTFTRAQLLANAHDVEGDALSVGGLSALHGTVTDNGDGTYTYRPSGDYAGTDTINYTIADIHGATVETTASFLVSPINDAPEITADVTSQTVTGTDGSISDPLLVLSDSTNLAFSDVDDTKMSSMVVHLDGLDGDTLGLADKDLALNASCELVIKGTDILVSYDQTSHTLTFSGEADTSVYANLARSVVLSSSDGTLAAGEREISFTLYDDGGDASLPFSTSLTLDDGTTTSFEVERDALGTVYWNGATPVLNGSDADDTFMVSATGQWSVNGYDGADTLVLDPQQGSWLFQVDTDGALHATMTDAFGQSHDGVIHLNPDSATSGLDHPFSIDHNQVVFNDAASGSIDFGDGNHVDFHNLEKIHG